MINDSVRFAVLSFHHGGCDLIKYNICNFYITFTLLLQNKRLKLCLMVGDSGFAVLYVNSKQVLATRLLTS